MEKSQINMAIDLLNSIPKYSGIRKWKNHHQIIFQILKCLKNSEMNVPVFAKSIGISAVYIYRFSQGLNHNGCVWHELKNMLENLSNAT